MARKSQRLSSSSQAAKPTHKRVASKTATPSADAKRSKTQKATPTRSRHPPDADKDEGSTEDDEEEDAESSSPGDDEASEFGDHAADSSLSEAGEDSDSEEAPKSRKKATPSRGTSSATVIRTKSNELWRPGVSAGLGPGKQVVIKKPKARAAGKTPYQDETIHSNTLLFLKDLKANNDRQWLKSKLPVLSSTLCNLGFRISRYGEMRLRNTRRLSQLHRCHLPTFSDQRRDSFVMSHIFMSARGISYLCYLLLVDDRSERPLGPAQRMLSVALPSHVLSVSMSWLA